MSKEKIIPECALPLTPTESPAGWKKLREAIDKNDWDGARSALEAMGLSPKLVPVFLAAISEEAELAAVEKAGEGKGELFSQLSGKLKFYLSTTVKSINESEKITAQIEKTQADATLALIAHEAAKKAARYRQYFHTWLPGLFGLPPVENPRHSGALSGFAIPPKLFQAGTAIKGQRRINFYEFNSWRTFDESAGETPRRKYSTFGAQPATNPIH